jgi:hypothetical protein
MTDTANLYPFDTPGRRPAPLDLTPAGCDADFDDSGADLERQFADLRLTLDRY